MLTLLLPLLSAAQPIDAKRGVDVAVDYEALKRIGPWSDQNYALTAADLSLLAPDEAALNVAIPAFYRVALRRRWPDLRREGPVQYPDSALPMFLMEHRGYLVDGRHYRGAERRPDGRWRVRLEHPVPPMLSAGSDAMVEAEAEARITSVSGASESAIEASPVDPHILVAGSNGPGDGQQMHYSLDSGATWNPAAPLPLGNACCDPTVGWSSDGRYVYTASLGGGPIYFYRSADNGRTWEDLATEDGDPRREIGAGGFADKEFLHVDQSPASPFRDNIYLTWQESNIMRFARSRDFGHSFSPVLSFSDAAEGRGIGSDITTDRAGRIFYVWPSYVSRTIRLRRSTDGGDSFGAESVIAETEASFRIPLLSMEQRQVLITAAADTDLSDGPFADSVYVAWTDSSGPAGTDPADNHARLRIAYSRDGGESWTVRTPHPTADILEVDRWNQWLAVAPDGTVHLTYYATLGDPTRTSVNLFHTFSTDGGQTWSPEQQLTTQSSPNISDSFEFGDYNGLEATMEGIVAVFTDNRDEEGVGGADSVDIYAASKALAEDDSDGFRLAAAVPGRAGVENTWTTTGGSPGGNRLLLLGVGEGPAAVTIGQCEVSASMALSRVVAFARADDEGTADLSRTVPAELAGVTLRFQALDTSSCELSDVSTTTF
jgi:hypothetical protein